MNTDQYSRNLNPFAGGYERRMGKFTLYYKPYSLTLNHVFTVSSGSRTSTPVVLTALVFEDDIGYGEASMPFYLGESHESVIKFLEKIDLSQFNDPFLTEEILAYIDTVDIGNTAAKASIDIALHDLTGKLLNAPWFKIWGYNPSRTPYTSFTIGIDTPTVIKEKTREASDYKILKVKLGLGNDKQIINSIREVSDKPLCVDVNQGWTNREEALELIYWLETKGVIFVEQPMPKDQLENNAWLTERSPIPTIGDEAVQRLEDVYRAKDIYSGVNIKLMKCTGLREAHKMIELARALDLKVMLGCMTETSCAISAAAQLSPVVDWADLDGALLISNDAYEGVTVQNGKIILPSEPGIGVKPNINLAEIFK